ncbi:hypothetical protein cypCar_00011898 [Cyprinus carpio]|nr:hypothetical protein cypCar_00011898 [Cyprinus carpio]
MFPNRSNNQALKVAGVTLLAGILIAGQAFTAYMAYSQKQQLSTLERRSDRLQEINRKSVMRAPLQMHLPMSSLALTYEEEPKEKVQLTSSPLECVLMWAGSHLISCMSFAHTYMFCPTELTQCQKEASGEVKSLLPSFHPRCDENGDYLAEQCWDKTDFCWCVDKNGVEMPDSLTNGTAKCQDFNSGRN